jgi:hypothetical protein
MQKFKSTGMRKWDVTFLAMLVLFFCACKKDPPPAQHHSTSAGHGGPISFVTYLSGQTWEVYAVYDSVTMDTIAHNDTLRFYSTSSDAYVSWNNNPGGTIYVAYQIYPNNDQQHAHFIMRGTPYGDISTVTPYDSISNGHLSNAPFVNSAAHTTTYLWMRRL